MNDFSNAAKRTLNLVLAVRTKPDQHPAAQIWAGAFGLNEQEAQNDPHEVNKKLLLLRHEIDSIEKQMSLHNFSDGLFKPYIQQIRMTVSPKNLNAPWNGYKNHLNNETVLALRYCSEILDAEPLIDFKELEKLLSELEKFKQSLDSTTINGATYDFIISQINIIENAIRNYPISGNTVLKKAFSEGFTDLNIKAESLKDNEDIEPTKKVAELWKGLEKVSSKIIEADRIAKTFIGIINKGQNLAENVIAALPNS